MTRDPLAREGAPFEPADQPPVGGDLHPSLQRAYDERRDPLDDPECVEALALDPAALGRWARLDARLAALATVATVATASTSGPSSSGRPSTAESTPAQPAARRRIAPLALAATLAAAVAAAIAVAALPFPDPRTTADDAEDLALPASRLDYRPPLARAAAEVLVRESLIDDGTTRLVVVETRTFPR